MRKYSFTILVIFVQLWLYSCVSFQIISTGYIKENFTFRRKDTFFLEPIKVSSYNFFEDDEIRYIMNKKLQFALSSSENITLHDTRKKTDYVIAPELIIKTYQERYDERNYYLLNIKVISRKGVVCEFNYEYTGTSSIFDGKVQNGMIKKFLNDFTGNIKT